MLPHRNWESAYWPSATLLGFFLTYGLFLFVPPLDGQAETKEQAVIELDFVEWQAPVPEAPPAAQAIKQAPIKPKPKPTPVVPKPAPIKAVEPEPILTQQEPEQAAPPEPVPEPEPVEQILTLAEPEPAITPPKEQSEVVETQAADELLPTPVALAALTAMPRFLHKQAPVYPATMRAIGKQATVVLVALIDEQGTVRKITIKKSVGEAFDQAAISALENSRFMAGSIDGKPTTVNLTIPIKFTLR